MRLVSLIAMVALAGALAAGCAKKSENTTGVNVSGPITDSGSNGLKETGKTVAAAPDAVHGKQVFTTNCSSCHGAVGTEGGVGPSLKNEKSRKDLAKTIEWIKNPQPPMPKLYPSPLGEKDVADAAAYIQTL